MGHASANTEREQLLLAEIIKRIKLPLHTQLIKGHLLGDGFSNNLVSKKQEPIKYQTSANQQGVALLTVLVLTVSAKGQMG
jgi:hypothetical protein